MKKYQTVVALQDAQVAVLNPKLTVGDVAEQVTVTGETIQLATYDSGTVSTQLDSSRIDQLPQNGRNVLGLAQNTVPGLEAGGTRANGLMRRGHGILAGRRPDDESQFRRRSQHRAGHAARPRRRSGSQVRNAQFQRPVRHAGHRHPDHEVRHAI